jgi:hypothetical protein
MSVTGRIRTRRAASSMASALPSSRVQIWATTEAFSAVSATRYVTQIS